MPDLKLLQDELDQSVERRKALREKHSGETLPDEARIEFEQLTERGQKLVKLIEVEKQRVADSELEKQRAYLDEPIHHFPTHFNGDEKSEAVMFTKLGWELKGGVWHFPTSTGKSFPMYPNEVLFGPMPDEADTANYVKSVRRIMQPDYRESWLKWYQGSLKMGSPTALAMLEAKEQKALSEGSDTAGGFIVPPDIQAEIGGRRSQTSIMRRLATVRPTIRDRWSKPMVAPNTASGDGSIFADDFVAAWVGETPSQSSIDVAWELFEIGIKKLRAYTLVSNDLIADSVGNLIADLTTRGGRSIGLQEDRAFIAGPTGNAPTLEPVGILNHALARTATGSGGIAYDVEGTTANTISNTTSDAGSFPKIKALVYTLPSQYTQNASWIMRRAVQGHIAALVDANGRPVWNSYNESGFGRPQMLIEGFPVENSEFVGADGSVSTTAATTPLIFGDISEYYIIDRQQMSVRVLTERFGDTDQTGLFIFERVGGGLWNYDAIRTGYIAS